MGEYTVHLGIEAALRVSAEDPRQAHAAARLRVAEAEAGDIRLECKPGGWTRRHGPKPVQPHTPSELEVGVGDAPPKQHTVVRGAMELCKASVEPRPVEVRIERGDPIDLTRIPAGRVGGDIPFWFQKVARDRGWRGELPAGYRLVALARAA